MLVDDLAFLRKGLVRMIESDHDLQVVRQASNGQEAVTILREMKAAAQPLPRVILMDVRMPVMDGISATAVIAKEFPEIRTLILTTYDEDDYAFTGLHAGAYGFLLKDVSTRDLHRAIHAVADGDAVLTPRITAELINRDRAYARHKVSDLQAKQQLNKLTPREYEIAGLIARGLSNQEIAQRLTLETTSVRRYVSRILDKTGLRDRTQIVITWFQAGMSD
ncbi:response regulator transcription factor [Bifidobacterium sp. B4107]|uniref:response regulator n=1 Tax=unclassified Bifidobacterium TaxID=2608897 RepID=UPI00226B5F11|nr:MULTISPECIES: response regulator transcription factor [unclassified Bifidobacterium]MCX8648306.1 response regulator transcription factor [Bifidobacterium sp. B4107]MCX8652216.1 response regulator transcription factor [Bifidobacterium sp. B4111]MCX8658647.1 response regulator transcription factor [Bifidobacterium sp. B4114]